MNKITAFYRDLTDEIYNFGWRVRHVPVSIKSTFGGECCISQQVISINKHYKNTILGCYILGHEAGHMVDFLDGKYPEFFYALGGHVEDRRLIQRVEWSATAFSRKLLKDRGFNVTKIEWTSKSYFKSLLDGWYEMYAENTNWKYSPVKL